VFERIAARLGRTDQHLEPLLDPRLADELVEQRRAQRHLELRVGRNRGVEGRVIGHSINLSRYRIVVEA
jgi:hypothetical protein